MLHGSLQSKNGLDVMLSELSPSPNSEQSKKLKPASGATGEIFFNVANSFRRKFSDLANSPDAVVRFAGYEGILVDLHPPMLPSLPLPSLPGRPHGRTLSKAVVQGSFDTVRRNYSNIFSGLVALFKWYVSPILRCLVFYFVRHLEDPRAWATSSYLLGTDPPDPTQEILPFKLYTLGSGSSIVSDELKNIEDWNELFR